MATHYQYHFALEIFAFAIRNVSAQRKKFVRRDNMHNFAHYLFAGNCANVQFHYILISLTPFYILNLFFFLGVKMLDYCSLFFASFAFIAVLAIDFFFCVQRKRCCVTASNFHDARLLLGNYSSF